MPQENGVVVRLMSDEERQKRRDAAMRNRLDRLRMRLGDPNFVDKTSYSNTKKRIANMEEDFVRY